MHRRLFESAGCQECRSERVIWCCVVASSEEVGARLLRSSKVSRKPVFGLVMFLITEVSEESRAGSLKILLLLFRSMVDVLLPMVNMVLSISG